MNLLERYLSAVEAELPAARANDIIRELRANLLDLLEAREQALGRPLQPEELADLLQQQGHPALLAQRYAPAAPLIAAEDMPLYLTVLRYGAALLAVLVLLKSLGWLVAADSLNPLRLVLQLGFSFIDVFASFLLWVTLSFYLCGRAGWTQNWRQRSWRVADLPRYPQARIRLTDIISDLTSTAFLLLLLWTPCWMSAEAQQQLPLALADPMRHWRWILTLLCLCSLAFTLYRLVSRLWQRWSLALYVAEQLAFAGVFVLMALQSDPVLVLQAGHSSWWLPQVVAGADVALMFAALVLLVMAVFDCRRWLRLH